MDVVPVQTQYLTAEGTRESFLNKKYVKSKSGTLQNCKTALGNLDKFALKKYHKNSADESL